MMRFEWFSVFLLGMCVAFARSQLISEGRCKNIKPVKNFDVNKMTGVWYLQYMYYYCPQYYVTCSVYNMSLTTYNGKPAFYFLEHFTDSRTGEAETRPSFKYINETNPASVQSLSYSSCFNDSQPCEYVSVGGDYSYFIFYCCKPYDIQGYKYETLGIRTREAKMSNSTQERILKNVKKLKLKSRFILPVSQNCSYSASELLHLND